MLNAIIFDFDGVIAQSVQVKTDAFAALFEFAGPDVVQEVVKHHQAHGGVSRFEKIKFYYKNFLNTTLMADELLLLCQKFSDLVVDKVVESAWVPGAIEALDFCSKKQMPLFIVSGTPEDEMCLIVQRRKIAHYFQGVFGSPTVKHDLIQKILFHYHWNPVNVIFVGDSSTDYQAAKTTNIHFIPVGYEEKAWQRLNLQPIPDLYSLPDKLNKFM